VRPLVGEIDAEVEAVVEGARVEGRIPRPERGGDERKARGDDHDRDERGRAEVPRAAQRTSRSSGRNEGRDTKSTRRCVESQNGFFSECPQRQSFTV
jgi:hypothetical protein